MKITGLKTFIANASRTNFVFVKVYTDSGIDGVGEATLEWRAKTLIAAIEELERRLIGADPFATEIVSVPTPGVERWLAQSLSTRLGSSPGRTDGICAGVRFLNPRSLVALLTRTA